MSAIASKFQEPCHGMVLGMTHNGGRPSKGDRYAAKTRLPRAVADAVWAMHDETGAPVSDIIARFVALGLDMPEHAPALPSAHNQEALELKSA